MKGARVRRENSTTYWTRDDVAGCCTVTVSVTRCMGDSTFEIEVVHNVTGERVSFLDEPPESVAISRCGNRVWHQSEWSLRERYYAVHDLGKSGSPPPHAQRPPRADVILATEAIGPECPKMFSSTFSRFFFAEDIEGAEKK